MLATNKAILVSGFVCFLSIPAFAGPALYAPPDFRWNVSINVDRMTDKRSIRIHLDQAGSGMVNLLSATDMGIDIWCSDEAGVYATLGQMRSSLRFWNFTKKVQYRLDDSSAIVDSWRTGGEDKNWFVRIPDNVLVALSKARTLLIRVDNKDVEYNVEGLPEIIDGLAECRNDWPIPPGP